MAFVAGDLTEITYNHPDVGTGRFYPKAGEDGTFDLGGYTSNDDAQMIAGNGGMIDQMNAKRWSLEATVAWDMNDTNELDNLRKLASSPKPATWTVTHINGTVWGATGKPVGDVQGNSNAGTIGLKISGGGVMAKIA